nr:hypothetical protein [Tanacetum cinerariifolium]
MSQEIVHIAVNSVDILKLNKSCVEKCNRKLKDRIKSLSGKDSVENVKKDIDEIETINIELERSVAKLISKNENLRKEREHLKSIYKDQFDSIRKTRVQSKEHSLKNELRKLKGKNVVDTAVSKPSATIALGMFKLEIEPISRRIRTIGMHMSKEGARNDEWVNISMRKCNIKKPIWYLDSGCSRHMTGVKSYLHKYKEQPGPKVVFRDDSICTSKGYGSIKCNGIVFTKFDEKRGTIFNSNKEIVMIALRGKHHRASFKTKKTSSIKKCLHLLHMDLFRPVTPRSINQKSTPLSMLMSTQVYIHNHKDHLGKFDEKVDDGYLLGYSLVSNAFRVFNTIRQQTEETYHITFDESPDAIKFSKPSVDNINIAKNERYPANEYLHPYEPSQSYQTNSNDVSFIEPYKCPELVVLETKVSSDQNGQTYQNDHNDQFVQNDEILNDDHFEHENSNGTPNNLGPDLSGKAINETKYRANLKESYHIAVKRIFRYLKGTSSLGLWYLKYLGFDLKGYSDSDYARCNMDRKSTLGACQLLRGKLVYWSVKNQQSVAMSSTEAEYIAAAGCCANIL